MKRLLCILSNMNAGGAETFLMKIYRNLDRNEYQMDFCINVEEKCFYEDEIIGLGGKIFRIPSKSENFFRYKRQLKDVISENKYKYVLKVYSSPVGFIDTAIAKRSGAEVCAFRSSNSSDGAGVFRKITGNLCRLLLVKYIDVKIAPSDLAAKYTFGKKQYKKNKIHILHNGVDTDVFKYSIDGRNKICSEFNLNEAFVVGHTGRFELQKNHKFLIQIFSEIKKIRSDAKLLLVGDGSLRNSTAEEVNRLGLTQDVVFAGSRRDIPDLMSAMDVFVFPSFYEGMPNTVIEAQATGLPCLISNTISKEADITGLVKYMSLNSLPSQWAEAAVHMVSNTRKNTYNDFIKNRYNIDTVAHDFVNLIFNQ